MSLKRGIYGSIQCIYGPVSVRIIPYYLAQKYGPFCIRVVNGPYLAVFSNFTDTIQLTVFYRKVSVNMPYYIRLRYFLYFDYPSMRLS